MSIRAIIGIIGFILVMIAIPLIRGYREGNKDNEK
jgi:hypothetical protein